MSAADSGVMAELDELIECFRDRADVEYCTESASPSPNDGMKKLVSLIAIRTRIAALVEVAERFDFATLPHFVALYGGLPDSEVVSYTIQLGELRALSKALAAVKS